MLWHWDSMPDDVIKVILYLHDVDHRNGCMVAMRHRDTNSADSIVATWWRVRFFFNSYSAHAHLVSFSGVSGGSLGQPPSPTGKQIQQVHQLASSTKL